MPGISYLLNDKQAFGWYLEKLANKKHPTDWASCDHDCIWSKGQTRSRTFRLPLHTKDLNWGLAFPGGRMEESVKKTAKLVVKRVYLENVESNKFLLKKHKVWSKGSQLNGIVSKAKLSNRLFFVVHIICYTWKRAEMVFRFVNERNEKVIVVRFTKARKTYWPK